MINVLLYLFKEFYHANNIMFFVLNCLCSMILLNVYTNENNTYI